MSYDHCSTNSGASCPLRYHSDWLSCGHMAHIWFIGVLTSNFIYGFWEREIVFFLGCYWSGLMKPGADCAVSPALGIKLLHFRKEWVLPKKRSRGLGDGMRREEGRGRREGEREWDDTIIWFPKDSSSGGHLRYEPVNSNFSLSQSGFSFCSLKSRILINLLVYLKQWLPYKWEVMFLSQQNPHQVANKKQSHILNSC